MQAIARYDPAVRRGYTCNFVQLTGNLTSSELFCDRSRRGLHVSQVSPISATFCKKCNSMNILLHCSSDFVAEPASGYTRSILVLQSMQHQKEVLCCQCE